MFFSLLFPDFALISIPLEPYRRITTKKQNVVIFFFLTHISRWRKQNLPVRVRLEASESVLRPALPRPLRLPSRSVSPWKRSANPWRGRLCSDRLVVIVCKTPPEALVEQLAGQAAAPSGLAVDSPKAAKLLTEPDALWAVIGAQAVAELNMAMSCN